MDDTISQLMHLSSSDKKVQKSRRHLIYVYMYSQILEHMRICVSFTVFLEEFQMFKFRKR